jgi:hypothetical protein
MYTLKMIDQNFKLNVDLSADTLDILPSIGRIEAHFHAYNRLSHIL